MITAYRNSDLRLLCRQIANLRVGEAIQFTVPELELRIGSYEYNGALFTPADQILGNIVGSYYTHSYRLDYDHNIVTFYRHEDTGELRYMDPDRKRERAT